MIKCPECGEPWVDKSTTLRDVGYLDELIQYTCENDHTWLAGEPRGEWGRPQVECESCGSFVLPHKLHIEQGQAVRWGSGRKERLTFVVIFKCVECSYNQREEFETDKAGQFLFGYPTVTGAIDGAQPQGWDPDDFV